MLTRLFIVGIAIFLSGSAMLDSTELDWDELVGDPCYNQRMNDLYGALGLTEGDDFPWGDAKTMQICSDELPGDPCPGCCYTVIYHDYTFLLSDSLFDVNNYYLNISGMYWDDRACDNCSREDFMKEFYFKLLREKFSDPDFIDTLTTNRGEQLTGYWSFPVFTKGYCFSNNDYPCDDGEGCCYHNVIAEYDTTTFELDTLYWDERLPPEEYSCEGDTCEIDCFDLVRIEEEEPINVDSLCQFPCDSSVAWTHGSTSMEVVPGCPTCFYKVFYHHRKCDDYYQITIDRVEFSGTCYGEACAISMHNIMKEAIGFVLADVVGFNLDIGKCEDKVRVSVASCWSYLWDNLTQKRVGILPCTLENCCWARYEICRTGQYTYTREYKDGNMGSDTACHVFYTICELICGDLPTEGVETIDFSRDAEIDYTPENKFWAEPNPTSGMVEIRGEYKEDGEIIVVISDINGRELLKNSGIKEGIFYREKFDLNKLPSGMYLYNIYLNGKMIHFGKISLNR